MRRISPHRGVVRFTCRDLLAGMTVVAVAISLRNWAATPGIAAVGILLFAMAWRFLHTDSDAPRHMVFLGYFLILLELAWCATANLGCIMNRGETYWNTVAPIFPAVGRSAVVLLPPFVAALVVTCKNRPVASTRGSRLCWLSGAVATSNVVLLYFYLVVELWFGMRH